MQAHISQMNATLSSSPCAVIWLISGSASWPLSERLVDTLMCFRHRSHSDISIRRCAAAFPPCSLYLRCHQSSTSQLHSHATRSSTPPQLTSSQPFTALPLNIILSLSAARTCPATDSVRISGSDALQQASPSCSAFSHLRTHARKPLSSHVTAVYGIWSCF